MSNSIWHKRDETPKDFCDVVLSDFRTGACSVFFSPFHNVSFDYDRWAYLTDIITQADKLFWFAERTKKLPKVNTRKYTFKIDGKTYYTTSSVLKDYPYLGTRQNLSGRAQRWLKGKAPRGKTWNPDGFRIKGVLIWVAKTKTDNKCKRRMDRIQRTYNLRRRNETL